ncbi:MAG: metalloregulator ArsR/SmtB family transcription factor [Nocardioidaceae bacterium]
MTPLDHDHPVDREGVGTVGAQALPVDEAQGLSTLMSLLADPTRLRVLFALGSVPELCVGDLALALGINDDQSSYALKQLRGPGLVQTRREGRVVFYRLADGFPHQLLDHCLRELLSIAGRTETR